VNSDGISSQIVLYNVTTQAPLYSTTVNLIAYYWGDMIPFGLNLSGSPSFKGVKVEKINVGSFIYNINGNGVQIAGLEVPVYPLSDHSFTVGNLGVDTGYLMQYQITGFGSQKIELLEKTFLSI